MNEPSYTLVNGACGFGEFDRSVWPYWRAVGLGFQNPLSVRPVPKNGCGTCIEITCAGYGCALNATSVIVLVADTCQNCTANQITMHASTFQQFMAPQTQGTVNATYKEVDCHPPGSMVVRVSSVITVYSYMRLAILEGSDNFTPMTNQWGATWQASHLDANPPFSLQLTDNNNETLILRNVIHSFEEGDYPTDSQFMLPGQPAPETPQTQPKHASAPQSGMSLALDPVKLGLHEGPISSDDAATKFPVGFRLVPAA
ncbi:hypothetical protein WJX73_006561 [Symbiochloris irregularis]|uniref:Expansin-like EG45 domain-containing protein n=1 Tax=Symbiochloris irregularis TaxID=706552 RepID=A0AAW1PUI9_9CHLO